MIARMLRTVIALLAVAGLAACGGDDSPDASSATASGTSGERVVEVRVQTFDFQPDPVTVDAGTTIRFRNLDKVNHSVTAGTREVPTPAEFDGVMKEAGDTFELTLDDSGSYDYFCNFHPGEGMTGQIIVQ